MQCTFVQSGIWSSVEGWVMVRCFCCFFFQEFGVTGQLFCCNNDLYISCRSDAVMKFHYIILQYCIVYTHTNLLFHVHFVLVLECWSYYMRWEPQDNIVILSSVIWWHSMQLTSIHNQHRVVHHAWIETWAVLSMVISYADSVLNTAQVSTWAWRTTSYTDSKWRSTASCIFLTTNNTNPETEKAIRQKDEYAFNYYTSQLQL